MTGDEGFVGRIKGTSEPDVLCLSPWLTVFYDYVLIPQL